MQDINDIMRLLPHRYPFLLVDRVLETNGDQLRFECTFLREKLGMIKMHCDATVDGQLAACADMMCSYRSPK